MSSSTRRAPLSNNPDIINSPLRVPAVAAASGKLKRPYATLQREEQYGHPPPKKQIVDHGVHRAVESKASQAATTAAAATAHRATTSRERASRSAQQSQSHSRQAAAFADVDMERWRAHHKARFPGMVFYFESIPPETHAKLSRCVARLGSKEERFFSIAVTHVVTTRPIPQISEPVEQRPAHHPSATQASQAAGGQAQTQTINPSLLNRSAEDRRKMLFELGNRRQHSHPQPPHEDTTRRAKNTTRSSDVLVKALQMGKKIWTLDKFQSILEHLLDDGHGSMLQHGGSARGQHGGGARGGAHKPADGADLRQLLRQEQLAGPSERMGAEQREMVHFRGPYIYVFDVEEKQKPMMIREYANVATSADGDWPQFRSVTNGRCPFIIEEEPSVQQELLQQQQRQQQLQLQLQQQQQQQLERKAMRLQRAASGTVSTQRPSRLCDSVSVSAASASAVAATTATATTTATSTTTVTTGPTTSTRAARCTETAYVPALATRTETDDGQSCDRAEMMRSHLLKPSKLPVERKIDFLRPSFTGRAGSTRRFAGEPAASGLQQSGTSAIRSQMISSASGVLGVKAGTSKEIYDLQRKVLQRSAPLSQPLSRQATQTGGMEAPPGGRALLARSCSTGSVGATGARRSDAKLAAAMASQARSQSAPQRRKRDLKPGYCENCTEKFRDFEEHILSRKHRRFAENDEHFVELDNLLDDLERLPRHL